MILKNFLRNLLEIFMYYIIKIELENFPISTIINKQILTIPISI